MTNTRGSLTIAALVLASAITCAGYAAESLTLAKDGNATAVIVLPRGSVAASRETAGILTDLDNNWLVSRQVFEDHHLAVNVATVAWGSWSYFARFGWSGPSPNLVESQGD